VLQRFKVPYCERLATLGLDRLELRRLRFDLIYVYKILFGMVETDASIFFRVRNTSTVTRGRSLTLFVPQSRLDVRKYFFLLSGCALLEQLAGSAR